jgi:hypothetical protein
VELWNQIKNQFRPDGCIDYVHKSYEAMTEPLSHELSGQQAP